MAGPTIRLTFAGDADNLVRALGTVGAATTTFQQRVDSASKTTIKASALMAAGVSAAAATAGLALAALPLAIGGLGVLVAAQNEQVKKSFTGLKDHVLAKLKELAQPFEPVLTGIATRAQETFDRIAPSLGRMFETSAPLVDKFATGIMKLVENLMPGFESAIKVAGPAVTALADGLAGTGEAIGQFFMNLSGGAEGGATAVTILFDAINTLLPILGTVIGFAAEWSGVLVPLALAIGGVATVVKVVSLATTAWSTVSTIATAATGVLRTAAMGLWGVMAANPIGLVITIIGALVAAVIIAYQNSETFRNIVLSAWAAVQNGVTVAVNAIKSVISWFGSLPGLIGGWFNAAKDSAILAFNGLLSFIGSVPDRILGLLSNLGSLLVSAGRSLVDGFLSGIKSAWDSVVSFVKQGIQWVRDLFPFSPAKDGPLSGRGYVTYSGKALTEDFAASLRDGMGDVGAAARGVLSAAQAPFAGAQLVMRGSSSSSASRFSRGATMPTPSPSGRSRGSNVRDVHVHINQASGSPGETARMVVLALRTVG